MSGIMRKMRIATWDIGSVRTRLEYLCHWLDRREPDIVALQKILVPEDEFPTLALDQAGYRSVAYRLNRRYEYGVAILSRKELSGPKILQRGLPGKEDSGARLLTAKVDGLEVSSVYAPYGNPEQVGIKHAIERKVAWLKRLREHIAERHDRSAECVLCGDFNVVLDGPPKSGTPCCTEEERHQLTSLLGSGFVDLFRRLHPDGQVGFNYGFNIYRSVTSRLHLILGTERVAERLRCAWVDLEYRQEIEGLEGHKWSQSAPVIVDLRQSCS